MGCECGHSKDRHHEAWRGGDSSYCRSFTCCNANPDRADAHDFVDHPTTRCACKCYTDADAVHQAAPAALYGLTAGVPDEEYHADRDTISSTGARKLLECPARFKWELDNPAPHRPAFDFGKVAHALVLGEGGAIQIVDADNWLTKAAKEQRAACYRAGVTPVLKADHESAVALRDSVMVHPTAGALFFDGMAELSGYWEDRATGIRLRFRPDWLTELDGQPVCVDLKTTVSADPREFGRSVAKFGYHAQAAWYLDGLAAHGVSDARFLFVCAEKTAPYPVSVVELDDEALAEGRRRNRAAIDLYDRCVQTGTWPAYGDLIHSISLPQWAFRSQAVS